MSQLVTIFEKIKEDFFSNHLTETEREDYKLIFSPFSAGFTYDDFLFLDSNTASENAHKYYDELYEFSQIANTIPREDNFWAVSDHQDYLFHPYRNILQSLRLFDVDTIDVKQFYDHTLFLKALNAVDEDLSKPYRAFFNLRAKVKGEIEQLKQTLNEANRVAVDLEIRMKEDNLREVENSWSEEGKKEETEAKILAIIQDEFKRFMRRFIEVKERLETLSRNHNGSGSDFYLTSCMPNNLYKGEDLEWKKISIDKTELQELLKKVDVKKYEAVMGTSELSKLEIAGINFDLLLVSVTRAWYDEQILNSPFWDINILNKEEIEIPRITSKLIFVRNVDVKLRQNSSINVVLLQKNLIQSLGPFIINTKQLQQGKNLKLNSVNKSLNLERTSVLDVGSKLRAKQKRTSNLKALVGFKQNRFVKLAPKLQSKQAIKPIDITPVYQVMTIKPMVLTMALSFVKCELHFVEHGKNLPIPIQPGSVKLFQNKKPYKVQFKSLASNKLETSVSLNGNFECQVSAEGYEPLNFSFKASLIKKNDKKILKTIRLRKIVKTEKVEAFQLIGVISKQVKPFPNPIKGASYI